MEKITFDELDLPVSIKKAIDEQNFDFATEIQAKSIPLIREGKDVIGKSQTGTGKTIAFGIPAIEAIDAKSPRKNVQVLIICPTRELAIQASDEFKKLSKYTEGVNIAEVYGGAPMQPQIMKLRRANVVIGTPGRIMDHLRRKTMKITNLKMIVLDEADEMLSMGFREDIESILQDAPDDRQTVLFSATMPPAIIHITKEFQKDPVIVSINAKQITLDNIQQYYYTAPVPKKKEVLNVVLRYHNPNRCIIFVNTKKMAEELMEYLRREGYSCDGLHGDMRQPQRTKVMGDFKSGNLNILIATDVAARGIDVNDIDLVINFDVPQNSEYYVHRIGRTGRAGKKGTAVTICAGNRFTRELLQLVRLTKSKIEELPLPDNTIIQKMLDEKYLNVITDNIAKGNFHYENVFSQLVENGISEKDIALCALEMHFGEPKIIEEIKVTPKKRERHKSDSIGVGNRIMLNIGRNQHCAPNHIVGAITEMTNLRGSDIGKIDIYGKYSVVTVPKTEMQHVIDRMTDRKICGIAVECSPYTDDKAGGYSDRKRDNPKFRGNNRDRDRKRSYGDRSYGSRKGSSSRTSKDYDGPRVPSGRKSHNA
ncbi:MAG: DEAD/DEAH box helicase [Clostridiales bacterium]|nr:DEAD/DEAH box helicase [Clostridiales bacterium]